MIPTLPQHWQLARLGDVCQLNPRDPVPKDASGPVTFVPMSAIDEHAGEITAPEERDIAEVMRGYTSFAEGDVLFAKITPCMENGKAAIARNLIGGRGFGSTEFHVLRPGPFVLAEWLFHFVRRNGYRRQAARNFTGTAGQQRVPTDFLQFSMIPVPPLSEQRRIVKVLNEADSIREISAIANEHSAKLIPAIFEEMFGNAISEWPTARLGDVIAEFRYGTSEASSTSGYVTLRIPNIVGSRISYSDLVNVPVSNNDFEKLTLIDGDLLFVRTNGNPEFIGRSGLFIEREAAQVGLNAKAIIFASYLIRARLLPNTISPIVLQSFLRTSHGRASVLQQAKTSAGQYNISTEGLSRILVPLLPQPLQEQFIRRVKHVADLDLTGPEESARGYAALHSSLLSHAFMGQLTTKWRTTRTTTLSDEADARDAAFKVSGIAVGSRLPIAQEIGVEIDRRRRDLTREQLQLLKSLESSWKRDDPGTWVFTHETLAESLDIPLSGNADAIRRHLEVFVARGLIIPISREVELNDGTTEWRVAYRRPHTKSEDGPPEDAIRKQELANLAKLIKELPK